MKVLLDACVWGGAASVLTTAGHEIEAVADWSQDPGDQELLSRAFQASQVVVTIDKDFGELAVVHRVPTEASFDWLACTPNVREGRQLKHSRSTVGSSARGRS